MGETLHYLLEGISVSLLLGENGTEKNLTLSYRLPHLHHGKIPSRHPPPTPPIPSSNLTNPSKLFQDLTGFNRAFFNHTAREFFYFYHLSPDIQAKCLGASRRMFELGCHPSVDYTFLTFPPPTTPTTTPT
jgi:hypothetical protein